MARHLLQILILSPNSLPAGIFPCRDKPPSESPEAQSYTCSPASLSTRNVLPY